MKSNAFPAFGSEVQYAEPAWYRGVPTPYYNEAHVRWRAHVRAWVEKELIPHVAEWEEKGSIPHKELVQKVRCSCRALLVLSTIQCVDAGIYASGYSRSLGGSAPDGSDTFLRLVRLFTCTNHAIF
jgi:hypothetical protein